MYKVATLLNLSGWVRNTSLGVEVVLNTTDSATFVHELERALPALASLDSVESNFIEPEMMLSGFKILPSVAGSVNDTVMPPDSHVCQDCLTEILILTANIICIHLPIAPIAVRVILLLMVYLMIEI